MELLAVLVILLTPAFLAAGPLFPFWWIGRYVRLRRTGNWNAIQGFDLDWKRYTIRVVAITYAASIVGLFLADSISLMKLLMNGRLLLTLIIIGSAFLLVDVGILMGFPPDRAVELRRKEEAGKNL